MSEEDQKTIENLKKLKPQLKDVTLYRMIETEGAFDIESQEITEK
jgi:uncharacterized protein YdcH (DUF465 family)